MVSRLPERTVGFALSLLFFLLATLSKPSVVMLPFVLALCVWWLRGGVRWRDVFPLAPYALISVIASAWTIWEQRFHARAVGPDWVQTFPERLIITGKAIWFYAGKLVFPHPLIFIYPRWDVHSSKLVEHLPLVAALAGLAALWFIRATWSRAVFFAALLRDLTISRARLFQRVFLSLFIRQRSFSVSGQYRATRVGRSSDRKSSWLFL